MKIELVINPKKKLPVAKAVATAFEISCPHCGADIPHPNGSLFWTAEEIQLTKTSTCPACMLEFRLPFRT